MRKAGKKGVHTLNLLFSWCVFGLLFSTTILIVQGNFAWPSNTTTWMYILVSCIFGTMAHFLMNYAARMAPAGLASIIRSSGIIWSYLLEVVVFHQVPNAWTLLGVGLILSSLGVIAMEKHQEAQRQQKQQQQRMAAEENANDTDDDGKHCVVQLQILDSPTSSKALLRTTASGHRSKTPSETSYGSLGDEIEAFIPASETAIR